MTRSCRVFLSINKAESVVRFLERHVCLGFKSGSQWLQQLPIYSFRFNGEVSRIHHNVAQNNNNKHHNLCHTIENTASIEKMWKSLHTRRYYTIPALSRVEFKVQISPRLFLRYWIRADFSILRISARDLKTAASCKSKTFRILEIKICQLILYFRDTFPLCFSYGWPKRDLGCLEIFTSGSHK